MRERDEYDAEGEIRRGSEHFGFFAHELRNLINTAIVAFEVLKTGNVGISGSTGGVLRRSLIGLRALVGRSLAEVRLTQGVQNRKPFLVSGFIDELVPAATFGSKRPGHQTDRAANRGDGDALFRPFEQRSADRTGLGLGLAFSRWGAEANSGRIRTRNLPGHGCVFIVDLPRFHIPALARSGSD